MRPCQEGSHVARLNFKMSRVGVYKRLSLIVAFCRHCRNLAEGGCLLLRFHFTCCRYFMGQVACRNLPWKGLVYLKSSDCNGRQKLEGIE